MRKLFGPKKQEVTGASGEFHNLFSSSKIVWVIKLRIMRLWDRMWHGWEGWNMYSRLYSKNLGVRNPPRDLGIYWRVLLNWIVRK